jgi:hypothetical protein
VVEHVKEIKRHEIGKWIENGPAVGLMYKRLFQTGVKSEMASFFEQIGTNVCAERGFFPAYLSFDGKGIHLMADTHIK